MDVKEAAHTLAKALKRDKNIQATDTTHGLDPVEEFKASSQAWLITSYTLSNNSQVSRDKKPRAAYPELWEKFVVEVKKIGKVRPA